MQRRAIEGEETLSAVLSDLEKDGAKIWEIKREKPSLERAFIESVESGIRSTQDSRIDALIASIPSFSPLAERGNVS